MANTAFNTLGIILSGSDSITGSFAGFTVLSATVFNGLKDFKENSQIVGPNFTASLLISSASLAPYITPTGSFIVNGITIAITGSTPPTNTSTTIFVPSGSTPASTIGNITASFNFSNSISPYDTSLEFITVNASNTNTALLFQVSESVSGSLGNEYYIQLGNITEYFSGGLTNGLASLTFPTSAPEIPLYITSASISSGVILLYPISTVIPQQ